MSLQTQAGPAIKRFARALAAFFFAFWVVILLAGADFPPPVGFLYLVWIVLLCSAVVYWRTLTYVKWQTGQDRLRYLRVMLDGILAGFIAGAILIILPGGGESGVTTRAIDYAIWFAVLALMGVINAVAIYFITVAYVRRKARRESSV
jgi:hypothetical protein